MERLDNFGFLGLPGKTEVIEKGHYIGQKH